MNPLILAIVLIAIALVTIVGVGEYIRRHDLPPPGELEKREFQEDNK